MDTEISIKDLMGLEENENNLEEESNFLFNYDNDLIIAQLSESLANKKNSEKLEGIFHQENFSEKNNFSNFSNFKKKNDNNIFDNIINKEQPDNNNITLNSSINNSFINFTNDLKITTDDFKILNNSVKNINDENLENKKKIFSKNKKVNFFQNQSFDNSLNSKIPEKNNLKINKKINYKTIIKSYNNKFDINNTTSDVSLKDSFSKDEKLTKNFSINKSKNFLSKSFVNSPKLKENKEIKLNPFLLNNNISVISEKISKLRGYQKSLKDKISETEIEKNKILKNKNEEISYMKKNANEKNKIVKNLKELNHRNLEVIEIKDNVINNLKLDVRNKSQEIKNLQNINNLDSNINLKKNINFRVNSTCSSKILYNENNNFESKQFNFTSYLEDSKILSIKVNFFYINNFF